MKTDAAGGQARASPLAKLPPAQQQHQRQAQDSSPHQLQRGQQSHPQQTRADASLDQAVGAGRLRVALSGMHSEERDIYVRMLSSVSLGRGHERGGNAGSMTGSMMACCCCAPNAACMPCRLTGHMPAGQAAQTPEDAVHGGRQHRLADRHHSRGFVWKRAWDRLAATRSPDAQHRIDGGPCCREVPRRGWSHRGPDRNCDRRSWRPSFAATRRRCARWRRAPGCCRARGSVRPWRRARARPVAALGPPAAAWACVRER